MQRTESTVIQVAPDYENAMIKEMERFGWSLQSRQEIHEAGDAYTTENIFGDYVTKRAISSYVKCHFSRSLSLPNLDKIRELESEYFGMPTPPPLPSLPKLFPPGGILSLGWLICPYAWPFWPFYYYFSYKRKRPIAEAHRKEIEAQYEKNIRRRREILQEIASYLR